jgi:hypothetical protein
MLELAAQRVAARGRLVVRRAAGRTRLARLHQDGAAKIRMPATLADPLEAVLINTAGGLTGGDRVAWQVEAEAGASVTVTTQACERLYRTGSGRAEVDVRLIAGPGARLAWLPQETIVFDRSAFARRLEADLAEGAEALILEATVFGRLAMGEAVRQANFHDRSASAPSPAAGSPLPRCSSSRRTLRSASPQCVTSSARTAAPAPGAWPELASFLRGSLPGTATGCASGWCR